MENLGVVGFTGAGANRLFSALTGLPAPSEYEAAVGVATVPDERLDRLAEMSHSLKKVPTGFELVHLALTAGATPGEGLGARVLGSLRDCDAILVVLRAFVDGGVAPDPVGDLADLELEFVMADVATVESRLSRQRRAAKGDKSLAPEIAALEHALDVLSAGEPISRSKLTAEERALLAPCFLLTVKPNLVVCNTGDELVAAEGAAIPDGALLVPIDLEAEIAVIDPADRAEMRESYGIEEPALDRVAHGAYRLLGLSTFLTTGDKESRAWTFRTGATAPECAGVIHSDLQRGFIRAEVIFWQELLEIGSWSKAREAGRLRVEGKDYVVQDGDVLEIRFNV
ncbi:MAG: putative GTPase, probable translation factor [Actinomycetia bacterium]|nr:putative GTPase, probable translation factor [Actinomycetes bacterium]